MNHIGEPTLREVIEGSAVAFGVSPDELVGPRRARPLTDYRQVTMAACRRLTSQSFPSVAAAFGRHYSTAIHACEMVAADPHRARLLTDLLGVLHMSMNGKQVDSSTTNGGRASAPTPPGRGTDLTGGQRDG